jgi:hypothetical protein
LAATSGRWNHRRVDARLSRFTPKGLLAQIAQDYGERVQACSASVLGLPPRAGELQYRHDRGATAVHKATDDEPLVAA